MLVLAALSAVALFPVLWMVVTALKPLDEVFLYPPKLLPAKIAWENFKVALTEILPFGRLVFNTVVVAAGVILGHVFSGAAAGYGFARFRFPGRDFLFLVLMSTMMLPLVVKLIPLFTLFRSLGWINTYLPLVVPAFFGPPFYIFLMRQYFMTLPEDIFEAAKLDGFSELGTWWHIALPMAKPALVAVAVLSFQEAWDDFLAPLIFLNDSQKYTVTLGLYSLLGIPDSDQYWNILMATATVTTIPAILVYFLSQKYLTQGIDVGSMR